MSLAHWQIQFCVSVRSGTQPHVEHKSHGVAGGIFLENTKINPTCVKCVVY